jgi:hypothetical protein
MPIFYYHRERERERERGKYIMIKITAKINMLLNIEERIGAYRLKEHIE